MNDNPHLFAIVESKMAQVRTSMEHNAFAKAKALLAEAEIYNESLRETLGSAIVD